MNLRDLWLFRELVYFMVWCDIKVRYKQTLLGAFWAILQPVLTMFVMFFLFTKVAKLPTDNVPYPIFAYAALVPWIYFANALTQASNSLLENERMITKIYFPRLLLPMSAVLSGLPDFLIAFTILIGMMIWYHLIPTVYIWLLPFFLLMATLAGLTTLSALVAIGNASAQEMDGDFVPRLMLSCNTDGTYTCGQRCICAGTEDHYACCR